ncbi:50S ribosomal protein L31e [Candidatus Pacearchaeota archaeon]|nr:50S ribosomal protein L31e [Candidatus Pacearchaeota archaeon]
MAEKKQEAKVVLEREYIIPLRKEWLKVPKYKRASKAVKALKQFLARHMKNYDRDLRNIKIDQDLNNEIRFRGIKKPPAKIRVKAKKFDSGIVKVELVNVPEILKFKKLREEKKMKVTKKDDSIKKEEVEIKKKEEKEVTEEVKEKEESAKEASLKIAKEQAREAKHISKIKEVKIHRKSLAK